MSYDYKHEDNTDVFIISSEKALYYATHIPSRSSRVISVTVNVVDTDYTLTGFVNFITPVSNNSIIRVTYAADEIIKVESSKIGASNAEYTVKANGISNLCRIAERESFPRSIPILRYYHVQEHTLYCDFYRCLLSHLQAEKFTVSFYAAISCFKLIPGKLLRQLNPEFVCSLSF